MMNKKTRAAEIIARLEKIYPDAPCALEYGKDAWKLLVMGILSAQCTDKRVNAVCIDLFKALPDAQSMANADLSVIEDYIRSCGLYKTKAKNLRACAEIISAKYNGEVPSEMDELLTLPGVGRKIANLIRGDLFGLPAVVTDTHCIRLSGRMGLCEQGEKNPLKVERELVKIIPPEKQSDFCHRLVLFGRERCNARNPSCEKCELADICKRAL